MLTLLGTIFGLLGSLAPEILKFFNAKEEHKHEQEMMKLQMDLAKLQGEIKITELETTADIEEVKAIYANAKIPRTGWKIVDGLISLYTGSVRPTITYLFMGTYMVVKYATFMSYTATGWTWQQAVTTIWSSEDFAVFSTIMAFWFGGRFLKYALSQAKPKIPTNYQVWQNAAPKVKPAETPRPLPPVKPADPALPEGGGK